MYWHQRNIISQNLIFVQHVGISKRKQGSAYVLVAGGARAGPIKIFVFQQPLIKLQAFSKIWESKHV